jgi:hypothetical protein
MKNLLTVTVLSLAALCAGCARTEVLDLSNFREFEFLWVPATDRGFDVVQKYVIHNYGDGRYTLHLTVYGEPAPSAADGQEPTLEDLPPRDLTAEEVARMLELFSGVRISYEVFPTYGDDVAPFPQWRWDDLILKISGLQFLDLSGLPKMGSDSQHEIMSLLKDITASLR